MMDKQRGALSEAVSEALTRVLVFGLILISAAAWLTHLYVCFNSGRWGFLIAGAIFFPIAIMHGLGTWVSAW